MLKLMLNLMAVSGASLCLLVAASGCTTGGGSSSCLKPGETTSCTCTDGTKSTRVCQDNKTYSSCQCGSATGAGTATDASGLIGSDAPAPQSDAPSATTGGDGSGSTGILPGDGGGSSSGGDASKDGGGGITGTTDVPVPPADGSHDTSNPSGSCGSSADKAALAKLGGEVFGAVQSCGLSCAGKPDCVTDCMANMVGLSVACGGCFGALTACGKESCGSVCTEGGLSNSNCISCLSEVGCDKSFSACSGLSLPGASCTPQCSGKQCGPNGCNGQCGTCPSGKSCTADGKCEGGSCVKQCTGKQCGPDGCDGLCGACGSGKSCNADGQCVTSTGTTYPDACLGLEAGASAPTCPAGLTFEGCCDPKGRVVFCDNGKLFCIDCPKAAEAVQQTCGWDGEPGTGKGFYNCGLKGADPSGQNPLGCGF